MNLPAESLLYTVFISSLIGSLHCVGMCGGLVALCSVKVGSTDSPKRLIATEIAYHLSRLVSYSALGAIAGLLGSFAQDASKFVGFQYAFSMFAGIVLILWGLRALGFFSFVSYSPGLNVKIASLSFFKKPLQQTGIVRGVFIGLMSGLLPCGWLYAYVLTAAGTQDVFAGVIVMIVFWTGTVPILVLFSRVIKKIDSSWLQKIPKITAVLIILLGVLTIQNAFNFKDIDNISQVSCH